LLAVSWIAWSATPAPAASKNWLVHMKGMAFVPDGETFQGDVTIKPGDTVTWVYDEAITDLGCETLGPCPGHSTTGVDGPKKWDSKVFGKTTSPAKWPANKYTVRFDKPGTYSYVCTPHAGLPHPFNQFEGMKAAVIVK
jgi:plastocyanin